MRISLYHQCCNYSLVSHDNNTSYWLHTIGKTKLLLSLSHASSLPLSKENTVVWFTKWQMWPLPLFGYPRYITLLYCSSTVITIITVSSLELTVTHLCLFSRLPVPLITIQVLSISYTETNHIDKGMESLMTVPNSQTKFHLQLIFFCPDQMVGNLCLHFAYD